MPEVLTETEESTRQLYDQGCEKYGMVPFMREVNALLREAVPVQEALRRAGGAIDHARLEREVIEAAKAELAVWEGFHTTGWTAASASARNRLRQATRALLEFESSQQQIKK